MYHPFATIPSKSYCEILPGLVFHVIPPSLHEPVTLYSPAQISYEDPFWEKQYKYKLAEFTEQLYPEILGKELKFGFKNN